MTTPRPNRWPNAFTLERVLVGGQPTPAYELESRRLIVTLPDTGHAMMAEQPDAVLDALRGFL